MEAGGEARETCSQINYRIVLFLLGAALLFGSYFTEPGMVSELRISGLLTTAAGDKIVRKFRKWRGVYQVKTFGTIHPSSMNNPRFTNKKMLTSA